LLTCELPFIAARKVHRSSCCCFFVTDRTLLLSPLNRFERQQSLFPVRDTTAGHWWRCPWSVHHFGFGFTCGRSTMLIWYVEAGYGTRAVSASFPFCWEQWFYALLREVMVSCP
jgi:hypothetical protein